MPKILLAPTAFKGSFSPLEVCRAFETGVKNYMKDAGRTIYIEPCPLADGGDGTLEALLYAGGGELISCDVVNAIGQPETTHWLKRGSEAVVELSSCCGLAGLQTPDPLQASTFGLGIAVKAALARSDIESAIVALGGSASTDGGSGALLALGALFVDMNGEPATSRGGAALTEIARADLTAVQELFKKKPVKLAVDVENQLLGAAGAARTFAPQKGASPAQVELLECALEHFAAVVEKSLPYQIPIRTRAGAGAAGGTAFGLAAAGALITDGFALVSRLCDLEKKIASADLVVTGEGRIDATSNLGKVTGKLVKICRQANKPLLLVAGDVDSTASLPFTALSAAPTKGQLATACDLASACRHGIAELLPP